MRQFALHKRFVPKVIKTVGEERIETLSTQFVALQMALPEHSPEELNWVINHAFDGELRDFWQKFGNDIDSQTLFFRIKRCKFVKLATHTKIVNGLEIDDEVMEFKVSEKLSKFTGNLEVDHTQIGKLRTVVKSPTLPPARREHKSHPCLYPGCRKIYANSGALWNHQHNKNHLKDGEKQKISTKINPNSVRFSCPYPDCGKNYANSGALWNHQHKKNHLPK